MSSLGSGLKAVSKAALDTVAKLLGLDKYTDPAVGAAEELGAVVKTASGYLRDFGGWLRQNAGWIGHATVAVIGLNMAFKGMSVASTAINAVKGVFATLVAHMNGFGQSVESLPSKISNTVRAIKDIPATLQSAGETIKNIPSNIGSYFSSIGQAFKTTSTQTQNARDSIEAINAASMRLGDSAVAITPAIAKTSSGIGSLGKGAAGSTKLLAPLASSLGDASAAGTTAGGAALGAAGALSKVIPVIGTATTVIGAIAGGVKLVKAANDQAQKSVTTFADSYVSAMGRASDA